MDLSVTQRLVRTGPDPTMLAPHHHSFFLGNFSPQYSQKLLPQHVQHNLEQRQLEKEQEKRQELQQLMHKSKNEQSAVASPQVRQALRERLMMKQAALERTTPNPSTTTPRGYRELAPDPGMLPKPQMVSLAPPPICDQRKDLALRRTASEPILKRKSALRRHINSRQNPLQRKSSAPPMVKHRQPENLDSSPSGSSTPISECSSPNDSLLSENGALTASLAHEAERLFLTMPPSSSTIPTFTAGVPEQADGDPVPGYRLARALPVSGLPQLYLPLDGSPSLSQRLQPMLILEPHTGLLHTQFLSLHGLSSVQQQQTYPPCPSPSRREAPSHSHRPLGRTRSEPTPYSQSPLPAHTHLLTQQQLLLNGLLKQNIHLGKLMNKPITKPRLTHFPSEDLLDSEHIQSSCDSVHGLLCEESCHRRRLSGTSTDSVCDTESTSSSRESLVEYTPQHTHSLSQSVYWEHQKQGIRKPAAHLNSLCVPVLLEPSLAHRPLFRTQSSPASTSLPTPLPPPPTEDTMSLTSPGSEMPTKLRFTTGLVYDTQMQKHQCSCGDNSRHPEHPGRIQSIWSRLHERGLQNQCEQIQSRKATVEELESVHSERHVLLYGTNPLNRLSLDNRSLCRLSQQKTFVMLPCGGVGVDNDTIWNEIHTTTASRLAAGCVTDLALRVAQGDLKNGFAVVRPPGHHASHSTPQGFCFFNSVAIAAKQLRQKLNVSKILIVDWDVHHGNGTQDVFYNDPCVMYISLHRYDNGNFFPGSGDPAEVGAGVGEGYNVNVAWTGGLEPPMGDAEYLAAFRTIVMPIAQEFSPDVVLISSGFDAVQGHPAPLGGYTVSAKCFGFLTRQLMSLAGGKVVLALEGGYDLTAICDATEACVSALLGKEMELLPQAVLERRPCANAVVSLERVLQIQGAHWASVRPLASTVALSYQDAQSLRLRRDSNSEAITALASLSMRVLIPHRGLSDDLMEGDGGSM